MDQASSAVPSADGLRAEVRAWVTDHWDPALGLVEWRERLVDSGWAAPSWPRRWHGLGLPSWADEVVRREIAACGAISAVPFGLAAPTILEHGPDALRARFLRPALTGAETWCQLFSEPGAGSDLAGLTTTAVLDGDQWIVNGQKVWNTSAHHANLGMLVARTDWDVPKHQGITYLVLPMNQPGVEVRPLRQMNGHASFNQVFLTDARIPRDWVVGDVSQGWAAALTTLAHERRFSTGERDALAGVGEGRAVEEARREAAEAAKVYSWYPQRAGRADLVVDRARGTGATVDPVLRDEVAALVAMDRASRFTAQRARAAREMGRPPGAEGSIGKLALSNVARHAAHVHARLSGPWAMLTGGRDRLDSVVAEVLVSVPAQSIAGGTDEIQHNVLGERALGLPREPSPEARLPFREVRRNQ